MITHEQVLLRVMDKQGMSVGELVDNLLEVHKTANKAVAGEMPVEDALKQIQRDSFDSLSMLEDYKDLWREGADYTLVNPDA